METIDVVNDLTLNERLFVWLNFDGGVAMDIVMETISGAAMWIPLYCFILYAVWHRYGWRGVLTFALCLVLAMGVADMLCGIFKHSGLLKNLWADFPARHRPMFHSAVRDLAHVPSYAHGPYGTVSAHAATVAAMALMSALAIGRRWYTWFIVAVTLLICYSRIYLACHFPLDLALGVAVGVVSGGGMYILWKKLAAVVEKLR
ncbi:MAG: phosphatase PAP2 family protein [Alistipes sp.]|jgi:undecaprenyl-diphosphatase|nr:phosphatase PAP2 family protein [Alistipes sp.]